MIIYDNFRCIMGNGAIRGTGDEDGTKQNNNNNKSNLCLACRIDPELLECGHSFCRRCINDMVIDHMISTNTEIYTFPCQTCGVLCRNPDMAEVGKDDVTSRHVDEAGWAHESDDVSLENWTSTPTPKISIDDYICQRQEKQSRLMWNHANSSDICDVTFLYDRTLVYISASDNPPVDYEKTIRAVSAKGRPEDPPLPGVYTSPQSLSSSDDGRTVTMLDRLDGDVNVILVFRNKPSVECWIQTEKISLIVMQWLDKVVPIGTDQISCSTFVGNLVVTFDRRGNHLWKYSVCPETPNVDGKCMDADTTGTLVISRPSTRVKGGSVILLDNIGDVIREFPSEIVGNPCGVCFTSHGHVLVADWGGRAVLLLTAEGVVVRKVLTLDKKPSAITVHNNDRYIAIVFVDKTINIYSI